MKDDDRGLHSRDSGGRRNIIDSASRSCASRGESLNARPTDLLSAEKASVQS